MSFLPAFWISTSEVPRRRNADHRSLAIALLNERLADAIDLRCKCHHAHVRLIVPGSIALHELFDEVHGAVLAYADLLAERVTQSGGVVETTICGAQMLAMFGDDWITLQRGAARDIALIELLSQFGRSTRRATAAMEMLGDAVSVDLLAEIASGIEGWQRIAVEQRAWARAGMA